MITIREAKKEDIESMIKIGIQCFPYDFQDGTGNDNSYANAKDWFSERFSNKSFSRYHVAEYEGKIVGYVFHIMIGGLSGVVQLEQIGVDAGKREMGVGTELIMGAEKFWKNYLPKRFGKPLYKMLLTTSKINDNAHNLYKKCGFEYDTTMKEIYWGNDEEIWIKEYN
jgi:ribosomal protein S18 acetylase RimI-like enzyme